MTDGILCTVIGWLNSEYTKAYWAQWDSLQLINGVLHCLWETPSGDATLRQLVVPAFLREKILQELHGSVTAGHFGIDRTYGRVQQCYTTGSTAKMMFKNGARTVTYVPKGEVH